MNDLNFLGIAQKVGGDYRKLALHLDVDYKQIKFDVAANINETDYGVAVLQVIYHKYASIPFFGNDKILKYLKNSQGCKKIADSS